MKSYLIILSALWPLVSVASTACDLEKAKAEVAASIAGTPRAFASIGESTSSEKNAVVGVSSSLAGHRSAKLLREAAEQRCSSIAARQLIEQHLSFADVAAQREAAKAELPIVEQAIDHAQQLVRKLTAQLVAQAVTITSLVDSQQRMLSLQQRRAELMLILSKQGEVPVGNIADALSRARFHESEAQRLQAEAQAVRGVDVIVSAGARRQLGGGQTEPFASIALSWSFGQGASSRAAADVGRLSQLAEAEDQLGVTQLVVRRELELQNELRILDRRLADLDAAIIPVAQSLAKLKDLASAEAVAVRDGLVLNQLQLQAEEARLAAMRKQISGMLGSLR